MPTLLGNSTSLLFYYTNNALLVEIRMHAPAKNIPTFYLNKNYLAKMIDKNLIAYDLLSCNKLMKSQYSYTMIVQIKRGCNMQSK